MSTTKHTDVLKTSPATVELSADFHTFRAAFDTAVESGDEFTLHAYNRVLSSLEECAFVTDEDEAAAGKFRILCLLQGLIGDVASGTIESAWVDREIALRAMKVRYTGMFHRLELMEANKWISNN